MGPCAFALNKALARAYRQALRTVQASVRHPGILIVCLSPSTANRESVLGLATGTVAASKCDEAITKGRETAPK
jgi:hypothetical protein